MTKKTFDPRKLRDNLAKLTEKTKAQAKFPERYKDKTIMWRPSPGENNIRILWTDDMMDMQFYTAYIHYKTVGKMSLKTIGENDPIVQLADKFKAINSKIYEKNDYKPSAEGTEYYRKYNKFNPTLKFYVPIIDRADETNTVKYWEFGVDAEKALMKSITATDCVNVVDGNEYFINDVNYGFDIIVDYQPGKKTKVPKDWKGTRDDTDYGTTLIRVARNGSAIASDQADIDNIMASIPTFVDIFNFPTFDELKEDLDIFIESNDEYSDDVSAPSTSTTVSTAPPTAPPTASVTQTTSTAPQSDINPEMQNKIDDLFPNMG